LNRLVAAPAKAQASAGESANTGLTRLRDTAILELLLSAGLRVSELCNLNQGLDLSRDEFSVRGKGDKVRVVFLSASAKKAVAEYIKNAVISANPCLWATEKQKKGRTCRVSPRAQLSG